MSSQSQRNQAKPTKTIADWYENRGRRWLRNLLVMVFAVGVVVPATSLLMDRLKPGNLPINAIEIRGDLKRVDVDAIETVVGPYVAGGVMQADVHHVAEMIADQPWVKRAWVRKRWPDTLEIQISAFHPVAKWGEDEWLDENAEVFRGSPQSDSDQFDRLFGPEGLEQQVLSAYRTFSTTLHSVGLDLTSLTVDERRAWRIRTSNDLTIELGREEIERRFGRFIKVFKNRLVSEGAEGAGRLVLADMRYPHGLAAHWQATEPEKSPDAEQVDKG